MKPTNHARLRLVLSLQKIISRTKCMPHVRGSVGNFPETVFTRALRIRRYLWQNCANKWYCAPFFTLTLVYISLQKYETWAPCAMCVSSTPVLLFSKVAQKKKKRRSQGDSQNFYYHYLTPSSVPNDESNEAKYKKRTNRYVQKTLYDKKCLVPWWLPNLDKSY